MQIDFIKKYRQFFAATKNEPVVIIQGSKRSGKTFSILQHEGIKFLSKDQIKIQMKNSTITDQCMKSMLIKWVTWLYVY